MANWKTKLKPATGAVFAARERKRKAWRGNRGDNAKFLADANHQDQYRNRAQRDREQGAQTLHAQRRYERLSALESVVDHVG